MVTLKMIAKEAGVSIATVSNVINGNTRRVSKETEVRILQLVEQLGYIPNSSARILRKNKTNLIAIILRSHEGENAFENPHNAALVGSIIKKCQERGCYTMVNMMESCDHIIRSLKTWNVDGAVLLGMFDNEIEEMCAVSKVPMVFIDSYSNVRQLNNVGIDDYKGGRLAAQHLIFNGHKKIAFVSPPILQNGVVYHRYSGFCDELKKNGLSLEKKHQFVLESDTKLDDIIGLGWRLANMKQELTAAFVTSDLIASFLARGLRLGGAKIPDDFSLIGFDNLMICQQMSPQLTTIAQNLVDKASITVDILFRRLSKDCAPNESTVLDVSLISRESVARLNGARHLNY